MALRQPPGGDPERLPHGVTIGHLARADPRTRQVPAPRR
jgi:hypothetical protein